MLGRGPEAISPTAHYTGAVWARNGLSHPAFATPGGRLMLQAGRPLMVASRLLGGPTLEGFLLARHRIIDHLLSAAIAAGRVTQVVEIAAGLSPRGWRFSAIHGDALTYVEGDLPGMAGRKRRALDRAGGTHRVVVLDAFADDGPGSLAAIAETLDPARGVAVVTEGLLNYFDRAHVTALWRRMTTTFAGFPELLYLSDLHVRSATGGVLAGAFTGALQTFVRGRVHLHFADEAETLAALHAAGFQQAVLHAPRVFDLDGCHAPGAQLVRVIEASRRA
jgi:O-methyltransferase involved in polyketide biosynthesis